MLEEGASQAIVRNAPLQGPQQEVLRDFLMILDLIS